MDKKKQWIVFTVISDIIFMHLSIVLAFLLRFGYPIPSFNFGPYLDIFPLITLTQLFLFYISKLYKPFRKSTFYPVFFEITKDVTINTLVIATISYFGYKFSFPRRVILLSWGLSIVLIPLGRILINSYFYKFFPKRVLIVGREGMRICDELRKYTSFSDCFARTSANILDEIKEKKITDVIIEENEDIFKILSLLEGREVNIHILPSLYELRVKSSPLIELGGIPLLELREYPLEPWEALLKRIIDILLSLSGIVLFSPLFAIIIFAIWTKEGKPVFYLQRRVGYRGREFTIYKFRTMVKDAEKEGGPLLATEDDPRTTKIGKILRKWRLDELPQLLNVLKGDMSIVGPRPERPELIQKLEEDLPLFRERLKVKPGITGLAQVFGRYDSTPLDKLRYDIAYIYNYTVFLDFKIMFFTLRIFFTGWGGR